MRAMVLLALMAAALSACQRPNPVFCTQDNAPCANGMICRLQVLQDTLDGGPDGGIAVGIGECQPRDCTTNGDCLSDTAPICDTNIGRCTACVQDTDDAICQDRFPNTPFCQNLNGTGACVACRSSADCHGQTCNAQFQCEPCTLHAQCDSGVCIKDSSCTSANAPGVVGTCAPDSQVILVDPENANVTCNDTYVPGRPMCHAQNALNQVSSSTPYVRILSGNFNGLTLGSFNEQTNVCISGTLADLNPWTARVHPIDSYLGVPYGGPLVATGLTVKAMAHATLEGMIIKDVLGTPGTGLVCNGTPFDGQTSLRLVRSLLYHNITAVSVQSHCALTVDRSWVGVGISTTDSSLSSAPPMENQGNQTAIVVESSNLSISNSVFWHNGGPGIFGGISLLGLSASNVARIVNITLVSNSEGGTGPQSVNCDQATPQLQILNSIFYNEEQQAGLPAHIAPVCQAQLKSLAWDQGAVTGVVHVTEDQIGFVDAMLGDLRLGAGTITSIASGGTYEAGVVPLYDLMGTPRPQTGVSLGAFQAPAP